MKKVTNKNLKNFSEHIKYNVILNTLKKELKDEIQIRKYLIMEFHQAIKNNDFESQDLSFKLLEILNKNNK